MAFFKQVETQIVQVVDGDTIKIGVDIGNQPCRLEHVDAPEPGYPGYQEAKDYIIEKWQPREILVTANGIDRYGRWIVTVEDFYQVKLHLELLRKGLVFHFRKYSNDKESHEYETMAKKANLGLWALPNAYTNWIASIKKREEFEKKKQEEEDKIPCLIFNVWNDSDSNVPVDFIPEEMVFCKNYQKTENPTMPKEESDCYIWNI